MHPRSSRVRILVSRLGLAIAVAAVVVPALWSVLVTFQVREMRKALEQRVHLLAATNRIERGVRGVRHDDQGRRAAVAEWLADLEEFERRVEDLEASTLRPGEGPALAAAREQSRALRAAWMREDGNDEARKTASIALEEVLSVLTRSLRETNAVLSERLGSSFSWLTWQVLWSLGLAFTVLLFLGGARRRAR